MPSSVRVLVVDDEGPMLRAIERLVRGHDLVMLYESDPARALELVAAHPIDIVVADFDLHAAMNGVELLRRAQVNRPRLIRVVMSGTASEAELDSMLKANVADRALPKPWPAGELQRTLLDLAAEVRKARGLTGTAPRMSLGPDAEPVRVFSDAVRAFSRNASDFHVLLDDIARSTATLIGNFCGIGLVSDDGRFIERVANYHADAATLAIIRALLGDKPLSVDSPGASTTVLRTAKGMLIDLDPEAVVQSLDPALRDGARALHLRSTVLAPLCADDRVIGIISILRHGDGVAPLDEGDLSVAQSLADHAALAITNARLLRTVRAELDERARADARAARQDELITELQNPVLRLAEQLLLVPLVGTFDERRANHLTGHLLDSIRTTRAKAVVIDVTGVPSIDSLVAGRLLRAISAARLMGTSVVVSGISGPTAQSLTLLGVELPAITVGDLQEGIELARSLT